MKKLKIAILLLVTVMTIIIIFKNNNSSNNTAILNPNIQVTSTSYLNLMPTVPENGEKQAYFIITMEEISKENFLNKYEVKKLVINNKDIDIENIEYEEIENSTNLRIDSSNYSLQKNAINLIIKEKSSSKENVIKLYNKTQVVN